MIFSYFLVWYLCTCFRDDEGLETCLAALRESLKERGFSQSILLSAESLSKLTSKLGIASIPAGIFDAYRQRLVDTSSSRGKGVIVHRVEKSKASGWTRQRYLFILFDPNRDGESYMSASLSAQFSRVQRIHRDYYLTDNSEFAELIYHRPASGRSLGPSLAAVVLGILERHGTLASISRVDHVRLVDEFTRLDALDEGILFCPDVQESQRAQKPCKPTTTTPLSSPSASFSALLSDATTASTPQEMPRDEREMPTSYSQPSFSSPIHQPTTGAGTTPLSAAFAAETTTPGCIFDGAIAQLLLLSPQEQRANLALFRDRISPHARMLT